MNTFKRRITRPATIITYFRGIGKNWREEETEEFLERFDTINKSYPYLINLENTCLELLVLHPQMDKSLNSLHELSEKLCIATNTQIPEKENHVFLLYLNSMNDFMKEIISNITEVKNKTTDFKDLKDSYRDKKFRYIAAKNALAAAEKKQDQNKTEIAKANLGKISLALDELRSKIDAEYSFLKLNVSEFISKVIDGFRDLMIKIENSNSSLGRYHAQLKSTASAVTKGAIDLRNAVKDSKTLADSNASVFSKAKAAYNVSQNNTLKEANAFLKAHETPSIKDAPPMLPHVTNEEEYDSMDEEQ